MKLEQVSNNKFSDKWSAEILRRGYTEVPNCLFFCQDAIGVSNCELKTLLNLCAYKFNSSDPYPSVSSLATNSGQNTNTIRSHLRNLERKGLVIRILVKGSSSRYDFTNLIHRLENHICNNPIRNKTAYYQKSDRYPYQNLNTKKDYLRKQNNKTSSVGEILQGKSLVPP